MTVLSRRVARRRGAAGLVPDPPTNVSATAGQGSASVSWTNPASDGGSPITGYRITSSPGGIVVTGSSSPVNVTGLSLGTSYTFTVQAQNAAGYSGSSAASNAVTPTDVPGVPAIIATTPGPGAVTVAFLPPVKNGGLAIDSYRATSSPGGVTATDVPIVDFLLRGINDAGGEFGTPDDPVAATSTFSNANPGVYDTAYHYSKAGTLTYLAGRGIKTVRLPFRLERLFSPTGTMVTAERDRITRYLNDAKTAGIGVILDAHNYGAYYVFNGTEGVRRPVGTEEFTRESFATMCKLVYATWDSHTAFIGLGLMNEPVNLTSSLNLTGPNLIADGTFDVDTGGFVADGSNTTVARSTTRTHAGAGALTLTAVAAGGVAARGPRFDVVAGSTYAFEVYASHDGTSRNSGAQINWFNGTTYLSTSGSPFSFDTGTFVGYRIQATAPPDSTRGEFKFVFSSLAAGEVHRIDSARGGIGTVVSEARSWEFASQQAVAAIRTVSSKLIFVGGYSFSTLKNVATHHPSWWIKHSNVIIENHFYPDRDNSGRFVNSYDAELTDAINRGYSAEGNIDALHTRIKAEIKAGTDWYSANNVRGYIGEVGWPSENHVSSADADRWAALGETMYKAFDNAGLHVTQWTTGEWWNATNENLAYRSSTGASGTVDTRLKAGAIVEAHLNASTNKLPVSPLTPGDPYTFTVEAHNSQGWGPLSAASASAKPYTTPGTPVIGTATAGIEQATVAFTAPTSDGGSPIIRYQVTSSGGHTATGIGSPIIVTGLTGDTSYTFTVKAQNAAGYSSASAASNSVTPSVANAGTLIKASGFENSYATDGWTGIGAVNSRLTSSAMRSGSRGYRLPSTNTAADQTIELAAPGMSLGTAYYYRCYFRYFATPPRNVRLLVPRNSSDSSASRVEITGGRKLELRDRSGSVGWVGTTSLLYNTWYRVELKIFVASSPTTSNGAVELRLDGTTQFSDTSWNAGIHALTAFRLGDDTGGTSELGGSFDWDDIAINSGTWVGTFVP